jgi:hypothetical protein
VAVSLDSKARTGANGVANRRQELSENRRWIGLCVRLDLSEDLSGETMKASSPSGANSEGFRGGGKVRTTGLRELCFDTALRRGCAFR